MEEKNWKDMNGWEKAWEVTIITGYALLIGGCWLLVNGTQGYADRQGSPGGRGRSVWTVGSGGKKNGSWSSSRHR
jgi:hypothetical protein